MVQLLQEADHVLLEFRRFRARPDQGEVEVRPLCDLDLLFVHAETFQLPAILAAAEGILDESRDKSEHAGHGEFVLKGAFLPANTPDEPSVPKDEEQVRG